MGAESSSGRSPVPFIVGSIVVGFVLAVGLAYVVAPTGSEGLVTGVGLLGFGVGWALMAFLTTRFSGQPQRWMYVPAAAIGGVGAMLALLQPGPGLMDLLGWVWPVALAVLVVWMFRHVRRDLRGAGRWLVGAVVAVLLVMAVAGGAMTVAAATSSTSGPGRLVQVDGRELYLECQGTGSPAVILQAGLGGGSANWDRIRPEIAKTTTACSYDRAGRGRSAPAPAPQDAAGIAHDLHDLLEKAGVGGPYILVGHSSGGPYVRVFQHLYADDVVGMALIDPQPADAFTSLPDYPAVYDYLLLSSGLAPSLARLGLVGPLFGVGPTDVTAPIARSIRDEYRTLRRSLELAADVIDLGDIPLVVVSAGTGGQRGWAAAQDAQATISMNAAHRTITSATHESLLEADSGASVQAILDVLAAVRGGAPLP